ncbi:MAG TPA: hypothetical protein DIT13_14130, partial [Verrucomicrobiales bacterium]|nr:hypothetical protein [Verrucomicrobiales bacterium]
ARVDAVLTRPSGGTRDLRYFLEGRTVLDSEWSALPASPVITQNNNGTETARFQDVAAATGPGYLRVKVALDADLDGTPEATALTPAQVWLRRDFAAQQTFSMPLQRPDLFRGMVYDASNVTLVINAVGLTTNLPENTPLYLEVLTGAHAGHRFEV